MALIRKLIAMLVGPEPTAPRNRHERRGLKHTFNRPGQR